MKLSKKDNVVFDRSKEQDIYGIGKLLRRMTSGFVAALLIELEMYDNERNDDDANDEPVIRLIR